MGKVFVVQLVLYLLVPGAAMAAWRPVRSCTRRLQRAVWKVGRRRAVAVAAVGGTALSVAAALTAFREPRPVFHDEFSYLLAADTFAHGRLANPPHPFWKHFESVHILQQPTYASKYPPAQGIALALGQLALGKPIAGVWITTALAACAVCWMLQGWTSGRWAFVGGMLTALHPVAQVNWGQSFWGGSVSVIGAALVLGGYARLRRRLRARDAVIMSLGAVILANHRPYEGLLVCAPVAVATIAWLLGKQRPQLRSAALRVVAPVACVLGTGGAWMAYYNCQVSGEPLLAPYVLHEKTYTIMPFFLWQSPRLNPGYRHIPLADYHARFELGFYTSQQTFRAWAATKFANLIRFLWFVVTPPLVLAVVAFPFAARQGRHLLVTIAVVVCLIGHACVAWYLPHYSAPCLPFVMLGVVRGLQWISTWRWPGPGSGRAAVGAILGCYLVASCAAAALVMRAPRPAWAEQRDQVVRFLESQPGEHLVFVRYYPVRDPNSEWVYNAADIDGAKIVWAHEMSLAEDRRLQNYFRNRSVWLVEADAKPPRYCRVERPDDVPTSSLAGVVRQ